jgi:hypothetical protein
MAQNDVIVAKEGSGGVLAEIALAPADIAAAPASHTHTASAITDLATSGNAAGLYDNTAGQVGAVVNDFSFRINGDGTSADFDMANLTASRGYGLPDASGTLALTTLVGTPAELVIACSDETSNLTTGTAKVTFRMPYAMTLSSVRASVNTAPTGSTLIVDINEGGSTILSTKLSIDASELTSTTAATAAVISDTALADDASITIDIDQIGSTIAGKGLKVVLKGTRA